MDLKRIFENKHKLQLLKTWIIWAHNTQAYKFTVTEPWCLWWLRLLLDYFQQLYFISDEAFLRSPFINNHTSSLKGHIYTLVKYIIPNRFYLQIYKHNNKPSNA